MQPIEEEDETRDETKNRSANLRARFHDSLSKLQNETTVDEEVVVTDLQAKLRAVVSAELDAFQRQLRDAINQENQRFILLFQQQTDRVLLASARSAAVKTREFVLSQVKEGVNDVLETKESPDMS